MSDLGFVIPSAEDIFIFFIRAYFLIITFGIIVKLLALKFIKSYPSRRRIINVIFAYLLSFIIIFPLLLSQIINIFSLYFDDLLNTLFIVFKFVIAGVILHGLFELIDNLINKGLKGFAVIIILYVFMVMLVFPSKLSGYLDEEENKYIANQCQCAGFKSQNYCFGIHFFCKKIITENYCTFYNKGEISVELNTTNPDFSKVDAVDLLKNSDIKVETISIEPKNVTGIYLPNTSIYTVDIPLPQFEVLREEYRALYDDNEIDKADLLRRSFIEQVLTNHFNNISYLERVGYDVNVKTGPDLIFEFNRELSPMKAKQIIESSLEKPVRIGTTILNKFEEIKYDKLHVVYKTERKDLSVLKNILRSNSIFTQVSILQQSSCDVIKAY
ncbi:hypothetical protein A3A93_03680 [Candidatus Roizmanbacteria bacterium RIFCSPLOWO2_01_FULL_38_12]|uniref:Uncharacterized protein n=1 Tax=Candidatus Roizmanbacteria bacterium RIFCSPLOWO2_01_FULL_38_12 TaxID=1802061 RepID=A0A1F7IYT8_9BACT|nr:MAG: hypothetical protein A2861_02840 [Candidatus Roizmanbacteria bacterium RIFCSPHIGHO2_01_FULL_38_15]OGK34402.1 MAG: hypothetical protein A3F59_02265 [Candidatus Roizmanbacteria bacterium RIFCSPHIGHO2_12_FULL_38_13]OGK48536.1 MAG: hypothetical protein A3A93_03680 [Candidatus Roizmanbacteria bacterium RIFCSPLOWO2_01_FULL_38_12]